MTWDPDCYNKFKKERLEPFQDLLNLVKIKENMGVIDLGCGTGELTSMLADGLPGSKVLGIDSSAEMLKIAKERERSGLNFELSSIDNISGQWNLIFSNAALHWLDNHHELIPRLFSHVNAGGQLVVQLPSNHGHSSQTLLTEISKQEPFKGALNGWVRISPVLSINEYAELLFNNGGKDIIVFEKVYPHLLKDAESLLDWIRGSTLIPYLERLPNELHGSFIKKYRDKLFERWPLSPVFFPFRRIFFAASRP